MRLLRPQLRAREVHVNVQKNSQTISLSCHSVAGSGLIVYFDTDDIEASVAKVRELGGTADDKQPVPTHGWFAACKDTEGTSFSLWQGDESAA